MQVTKYIFLLVLLIFTAGCKQNNKNLSGTSTVPAVANYVAGKNVAIEINLSALNQDTILLESYFWDKFTVLTGFTDAATTFTYVLTPPYNTGLYRLRVLSKNEVKPFYFVVNGIDPKIVIDANEEQLRQGIANIKPDNEVACLNKVIALFNSKMQKQDSIKTALSGVSIVDPKYYTKKNALRELYELNNLSFYKALDTSEILQEKSYCKDVITGLLRKESRYEDKAYFEQYENEPALLHKTYWNRINELTLAYFGHPLAQQQIQDFIGEYAGETEEEINSAVSVLIEKINDKSLKRNVAEFIVYYYLDRGRDRIAEKLAYNFIEGCNDDLIASMKMADRYTAAPVINTKAPTLTAATLNGSIFTMDSVYSKHKLTILYFWKPDCSYCEAEVANIKDIRTLFYNEDFDVTGVCISNNSNTINEYVRTHRIDWRILLPTNEIQEQQIKAFAVRTTPKVYIISADGRILAADLTGPALRKFISAYFNKSTN